MARTVLIVNPYASRVTPERTAAVARELGDPEICLTEAAGHATELAREVAGAVEALYVFSGDGGFNEVVNGIDGATPVGFVPGGGTSVLPRALGLPRDPVAAARALAHARPRTISLGRANGRRFAFSAGVGFAAELVRSVDALGRTSEGRRPGDVAFVATAARLLLARRGRLPPVLSADGLGRLAFLLVANGDPYTYAGRLPLRAAPRARFELGLDAVGPVAVRPHAIPRLVSYVVRGGGHERAGDVRYAHDVDSIGVRCDVPLALHVDGEDLGNVDSVAFSAERAALSVLVPIDARQRGA